MRSPFGSAVALNKAPVPLVSRGRRTIPMVGQGLGIIQGGPEVQMRAMGSSGTLYAIVTRCATATAAAEWKLWRSSKSGKKEDRVQVTRHLALERWNKPNPFMTQRQFVETFQQHLDLCGEGWWVLSYDERLKYSPLEMWPVRPDRMEPVPDPELFIKGYEYLGPDGDRTPLTTEEVVFLRMPNPLDLYRGMGPVQAILTSLDSAQYSAEWNRNFFKNSASPGGIIEYEEELQDEEYKQLVERWREQHQGVGNAHRVAIIERGKWVDRNVTQRDMQFVELWDVARETIREAFAFPKPLLGAVDDVNRANAEAAEVVFARWLVKDRLDRIKDALNTNFLPKFGPTGEGLEFDYENPVPDDREADNAALTAKAGALKIYVDLGADWDEACESLDIPKMKFEKPAPPPAPTFGAPSATPGQGASAPKVGTPKPKLAPAALAYAWSSDVDNAVHTHPKPDLDGVQTSWEIALAALVASYGTVRAAQLEALAEQITTAIDAETVEDLTNLDAPDGGGSELLAAAMVAIAASAGAQVVDEAAKQGVQTAPAHVSHAALTTPASITAAMLAGGLALAAGREALRVWRAEPSGAAVANAVRVFLLSQGDGSLRAELGAALTYAQNQGRFATFLAAPVAALYASEENDKNTCKPCSEIDGRWLGNTDGMDMSALLATYPNSGYVGCLGRDRCRGTVTAVWRSQTTRGK